MMTENEWKFGEGEEWTKFSKVCSKVGKHTLCDGSRLWELWFLVNQVKKLDGSLIEVGSWRGGSGGLIAKKARECGIDRNIYICDTFEGVVKAGEKDSHYKGGEHSDTSVKIVEDLLYTKLGLDKKVKILPGIFPEDTADVIDEDEKFCFCHIDVDVYQSAKDVVEWLWKRLVIGGIIVFDDYGYYNECIGISKYVHELMDDEDKFVITSPNRQAYIIKIKEAVEEEVVEEEVAAEEEKELDNEEVEDNS